MARTRLRLQIVRLLCLPAVAFSLASLPGCGQSAARVAAPDWDPSDLTEQIMAELDASGDARLDEQELAAAPGLAAGARYVDKDNDGALTAEELEARFTRYRDLKIGLRSPAFRLTYKGRPVAGADVTFTPEPFLEGIVEPARGTTDMQGVVTPQAEGQDLPGMRIGYYRVQVTSPRVKIPERYAGADTTLGADVSLADDASSYGAVELKLVD